MAVVLGTQQYCEPGAFGQLWTAGAESRELHTELGPYKTIVGNKHTSKTDDLNCRSMIGGAILPAGIRWLASFPAKPFSLARALPPSSRPAVRDRLVTACLLLSAGSLPPCGRYFPTAWTRCAPHSFSTSIGLNLLRYSLLFSLSSSFAPLTLLLGLSSSSFCPRDALVSR